MDFTVVGCSHVDRVDIRCEEAVSVPLHHIQPRTIVIAGAISVLGAESLRLHLSRASKTCPQTTSSCSGVSAPTYKSSAILATEPA